MATQDTRTAGTAGSRPDKSHSTESRPDKGRTNEAGTAIQDVMARQRAFFATGRTIDVGFRIEALRRLQDAIRANEAKIEEAIRQDLGKSAFESYMCEVGLTLSELAFQLRHVRRWAKPHRVPTDLANFHSTSFTIAEPYGVTLVMSPWNYPFMLTVEPLIGAIAAGNCCVVKPSAYSPATSHIIAELVGQVFEPGHVDVVLGGRAENAELLEQRFDYVFFTGSVAVGKLVMEKASRWPTPVSLELGGKSPCVVCADANLDVAAARIAFGKYLNRGQTCVAPDYLLVDERVADELLDKLKAQVVAMYGADAFANADWGRIVNEKHFDRIMGLIDPAKVMLGGRGRRETLQIEPTIMRGCTGEDAVMQEEIFGPVLPVLTYRSLQEAEEFIKGREKPLALYLFTNDKSTQERFLRHVPFGGGCVNDTIVHLATSHMGFGGVGASGMGSYHGIRSFRTFTHEKSILKKRLWIDLPMRYQPYTPLKERLVRMFLR